MPRETTARRIPIVTRPRETSSLFFFFGLFQRPSCASGAQGLENEKKRLAAPAVLTHSSFLRLFCPRLPSVGRNSFLPSGF